MIDKPPLSRFTIRNGTRPGSFMIWDRDIRGPAKLAHAQLAINLSQEQAEELKEALAKHSPPAPESKSD